MGAVLVVPPTTGPTCRLSPPPLALLKCQHSMALCLPQIPCSPRGPLGEEWLKGKCQVGHIAGAVPHRRRPVSLPSCPVLPTLHPEEPGSPLLWGCSTRTDRVGDA